MRRFLVLTFAVACAPAAPAAPHPTPAPTEPPRPPVPAVTAAAEPATTAAPKASEPAGARARFPDARFPPENFTPPSSESAKPGDGHWTRLGGAADRLGEGEAVMVRTVVHPHPRSRFMLLDVVAIDLERVALHFSPGNDDPELDTLPDAVTPGLVPARDRDSLLAVFNGGFKPRHGNWGMMVAGRELVPPRPEGCTIAMMKDGTVRIGSWPSLSDAVSEMTAYRQTPPCLLEGGELHEQLLAKNERAWGGADPNRKTRRRSALGIDASGRVLLYGMGTEVGPEMLAVGMKHAGAVVAAQLDINWSWTKFLLMGQDDGALRVTSTLIPKTVHAKNGYVERSAARDFFYVTRR